MNWEAVGAIGEIAGAIGVIVTLVYLATQIRQNTKASNVIAVQAAIEGSAKWHELMASDVELAEVFWRALEDPEAVSAAERRQFASVLLVFLRREQLVYYLHQQGTLPEQMWTARIRTLCGVLNQPGAHLFLEAGGETLPDDFRQFLKDTMADESTMTDGAASFFTQRDDT